MANVKLMTTEDHLALATSRMRWQPGDYINPMRWSGQDEGSRGVLKVTQRHEDRWGVWYHAVDKQGHEQEVYVSDDPRPADRDQIAEFNL